MSKDQWLPRPPVEGTSQPPMELRPQATRFKAMALDRALWRVGVVGYGRLGEFRAVWGLFPRPVLEAPKASVSSTNTPFVDVSICTLAVCMSA